MFDLLDVSILRAIYANWKWVGLATLALTVWKVLRDTLRGGNFIANVLSGRISRAAAYRKMLAAFWRSKTLFLDFGARRLAAARFIAELEILLPDIPKPEAIDYDPADYAKIEQQWQQTRQARDKLKQELFEQYFDARKLTVLKWLWQLFKSLFAGSEQAKRAPNIVPISDIRGLDSSRRYIKRYFDALSSVREDESKAFIATAEFQTGYLAPLFLITGLINRFGEDEGWKLILDNYRQLVMDDVSAYSSELVELRSFLFNCWLLWGPSISPCSCDVWKPRNGSTSLILQYGYGDENNSIDILIREGAAAEKVKSIRDNLNSLDHTRRDALFNPIATMGAPYSVRGTFNWGPTLGDAVPTAQCLVQGGALRTNTMNGRVVLECDAEHVESAQLNQASRYYSAYIWIMFRIEAPDGRSFFPDMPWKDLLVFFEHGNLADATTFQTLKESLAVKTCSALAEILQRPADRDKIRISYLCALDHSNCGPNCDIVFPPQDGVPGKGARPTDFRPTRLIEIIAEHINALPPDHVLRSGRLDLPVSGFPSEWNPRSSCHLPELVEAFYDDLRTQSVRGRTLYTGAP